MIHNLPEKDDAPWIDSTYDGFMTHEEMLEEAARREAKNIVIAKVSDEDYQKVLDAMKAVEKLYEENGDALQQLADIEKEEL